MTLRRSTTVKLTLLPMLASAAVASADSITDDPPPVAALPTDPIVSPPGLTPTVAEQAEVRVPDPGRELGPQDMVLSPPGMTPTIDEVDCDDPALPYWEYQLLCEDMTTDDDEVVVRGGFGSYFWSGGG